LSETAPAVRIQHLAPGEGPSTSAFALALRTGHGDALRFLDTPPRDDEAWATLMERTAASAPVVPLALAEALAECQRALAAGPRAEENARARATNALQVFGLKLRGTLTSMQPPPVGAG